MENSFSVFKNFADILPDFAKNAEPICQKNSLTSYEGLTLILISFKNENLAFCNNEIINSLKSKGLLNENCQISSKGSIVAKSLILTFERLNF